MTMRIFIQKFQTKVFATLKAHWMIELTNMNQRRFNLSLAQILERDDGLHPTDMLRNPRFLALKNLRFLLNLWVFCLRFYKIKNKKKVYIRDMIAINIWTKKKK